MGLIHFKILGFLVHVRVTAHTARGVQTSEMGNVSKEWPEVQ